MLSRSSSARNSWCFLKRSYWYPKEDHPRYGLVTSDSLKSCLPWGFIDLDVKDKNVDLKMRIIKEEVKVKWSGLNIPNPNFCFSYWGRLKRKDAWNMSAPELRVKTDEFRDEILSGMCGIYKHVAEAFNTNTDFEDYSHCMTGPMIHTLNEQIAAYKNAGKEVSVEVESVEAKIAGVISGKYCRDPDYWNLPIGKNVASLFNTLYPLQNPSKVPLRLNLAITFDVKERFIVSGEPVPEFTKAKHEWNFYGLYQSFVNEKDSTEDQRTLLLGNINFALDAAPIPMQEDKFTWPSHVQEVLDLHTNTPQS